MSVLYKQAAETKIFFIEFSNQLASGDSLSALTSVLESTGSVTITSKSISGTKVQATYAAGTNDTTYTITAIVVTTNGETLELDVYLRILDQSTTKYLTSYFGLLERIGHFLFGKRNGYTGDQVSDIEECMKDGLRDVYALRPWSFFRPVEDISTTAPYSTGTVTVVAGVVTLAVGTFPSWAADGLLKVSDNYYSVATRDSGTQVTLDDTTVTVASGTSFELGRPDIPLDASFEDMANDRALSYYPDQNELYPPVRNIHDQSLRVKQQDYPFYDRPVFYSIRTVEYDKTVGSRRVLTFYPTPDKAYILRAPMILRPTMIDESNIYPVGGEMLTQLIIEACLAAAERNYDETQNMHTLRYQELLPLAIRDDLERSTPVQLGRDMPRDRGYHSGAFDSSHWARSVRIGTLSLDGSDL